MKTFKNSTLLFLSAFLAGGMFAAYLFPGSAIWVLTPAPFLFGIFYVLSKRSLNSWMDKMVWVSSLACFAWMGSVLFWVRESKPSNHISHYVNREWVISGKAIRDSKSKTKANQVLVSVESIEDAKGLSGRLPVSGKILLYFPKGQPAIQENEKIEFRTKLQNLRPEFSERGGWAFRNDIGASGMSAEIKRNGFENSILGRLAQCRKQLELAFKSQMPDPAISSLAVAMLLGNQSDLDPEISEVCATTGVSHIISISGLHVAIIFEFILLMAGLAFPSRIPNAVKVVFCLLVLWTYALLTGANPAACRASFMISLVMLARSFSLRTRMGNILGFSGMMMLAMDPFLILDIGFQLSFIAVLGLIVLSGTFQTLSEKNFPGLPSFIHEINGASLAAQLFTLPLILFHFGQFPVYFLLANLVVIPLADFSIKAGFSALVLSFIPGINTLLFTVLDLLLWVITLICQGISQLPGAVASSFSFQDAGFRTFLILSLAAFAFFALKRKQAMEKTQMESL